MLSALESVKDIGHPDHRKCAEAVHPEDLRDEQNRLLGTIEIPKTFIITKEEGTVHDHSHMENTE